MNEADTRLKKALRLVFQPLANLLLKNHIGIAPVVEQLKLAYVDAAQRNHGRGGKPATVNMISNLTGMSRAHVVKLVGQIEQESEKRNFDLPCESSILGRWANSEEYLDELGRPRPLALGPGEGTLHNLVAGSVPLEDVDAVVTDLLSSRNLNKRSDGKFELSDRAFRINTDLPRCLAVFLATFTSTIDRNWGRLDGDVFGLRVAHSGQVGSHNVANVRRMSKQRISEFLEEFDDLLCSFERESNNELINPEGQELSKIGVGAYYFETDA